MLFKRAPKLILGVTVLVWAIASLLPIPESAAGPSSDPVAQQAQSGGGSTTVEQGRITPIVQSNSVGDPDDYATGGDGIRQPKEEEPTIWSAIELALRSIIDLVGGRN